MTQNKTERATRCGLVHKAERKVRLRNIPGAKEEILHNKYVVDRPQEYKGRWNTLFEKEGPLHIEIGMGKGRFIMDMAALHPDVNYIGIEMYDSVLLRAVQKRDELAAEGKVLNNCLFIREDARLLPDIFEKNEAERIYLNFSDPWPKARHAKRRLTSRQFLERYDKILVPDGRVVFKTDNRELFDFSLEEAREAGWHTEGVTYDLHSDPTLMQGNVMTEYEEKFSGLGKPICRLAEWR